MKNKQLAAEVALRRKITTAQQPKPNKPPQHIRARTPPNTLGLRNVVNLRSLQTLRIGGGAAIKTDVPSPSLNQSLGVIGTPGDSMHSNPFGMPIYTP